MSLMPRSPVSCRPAVFECIVLAVQHLHSLDIVHHDLKMSNMIRYYDGRVRCVWVLVGQSVAGRH